MTAPESKGYDVAIRRLSDGAIRVYHENEVEWGDHSIFWWTDGNMGCGNEFCNMHEAFERAGGTEPDFPKRGYCNGPALFVVDHFIVDGKRIEVDE